MKREDPNPRPVRERANEGSVSPVGSGAGKRPEFVSVKRVQTPLQGVCTTIERTDESRRAHFPEANENKRGQMKVEVRGSFFFTFAGVEMCSNLCYSYPVIN